MSLSEEDKFRQPLSERMWEYVEPYTKNEYKDVDSADVWERAQSAKRLKELFPKFTEHTAAMQQESGQTMAVPIFKYHPELAYLKPDAERAFLGKGRLGGVHEELDKDGKKTGKKYQITGLGDLVYDTATKKLSAQLQAVYLDKDGKPANEQPFLVPATEADKDGNRTNAADAVVKQGTLEEMGQWLDQKINGSILLLKAREQAAQQVLVKHSPEARKTMVDGLNKDLVERRAKEKSNEKITAFKGTATYKQLKSDNAGHLQALDDLRESGAMDDATYTKAATELYATLEKLKTAGEQGKQAGALMGLLLKAKSDTERGEILGKSGAGTDVQAAAIKAYKDIADVSYKQEANDIRLLAAENRGAARAGGGGSKIPQEAGTQPPMSEKEMSRLAMDMVKEQMGNAAPGQPSPDPAALYQANLAKVRALYVPQPSVDFGGHLKLGLDNQFQAGSRQPPPAKKPSSGRDKAMAGFQ